MKLSMERERIEAVIDLAGGERRAVMMAALAKIAVLESGRAGDPSAVEAMLRSDLVSVFGGALPPISETKDSEAQNK